MLRTSRRLGLISVLAVIGCGVGLVYVYHTQRSLSVIRAFDYVQDIADVKNLFVNNHYMLTTREYDPEHLEFTFATQSPNEYDAELFGKMHIDVLREGHQLVGFVTYYMQSTYLGRILFLAIDEKFRGKRYGEKLLRHAINKLFSAGAVKVQLLTRVHNYSAQKLYRRVGFSEDGRDEEFIYFGVTSDRLVAASA